MDDDVVLVTMEMIRDFEFRVRFGEGLAELLMDEPEPLGSGRGPSASRVLIAAIGNCLSASLLFCLRKARVEPSGLRTEVVAKRVRNERGRLRIDKAEVTVTIDVDDQERGRLDRCAGLFEDFCIVTASVRKGVDVAVRITDTDGPLIYNSAESKPDPA
jgi:uncharacterized OsmC-like protein